MSASESVAYKTFLMLASLQPLISESCETYFGIFLFSFHVGLENIGVHLRI